MIHRLAIIAAFALAVVSNAAAQPAPRGVFRAPGGAAATIYSIPGDNPVMVYVEFPSGSIRSLSPVGDDRYTFGPTLGLPEPIEGEVRVTRDSAQLDIAIERTRAGATDTLTRLPLREVDVSFANGDVTLAGTLIIPEGDGPHPAVMLLHGSSPEPREGSLGIAYLFASQGVAALVFDKRGIGQSVADSWVAPFADYAADGVAGFNLLRSRDDIDPDRVGFWGHSQGAWIAALAASQTDAAFVILECGGAVTPVDASQHWGRHQLRTRTDLSSDEIDAAIAYRALKYAVVAGAATQAELDPETERVRNERWFQFVTDALPNNDFWLANIHYDPLPALRALQCPVLAIYAEHDDATPTPESTRILAHTLIDAGHSDFTIRVFPDANHALMEAPTGANFDREPEAMARLTPGYIDQMITWLRTQTRRD